MMTQVPGHPHPGLSVGWKVRQGGTAKESGKRLKLREQGHRGIALGDGRTGASQQFSSSPQPLCKGDIK